MNNTTLESLVDLPELDLQKLSFCKTDKDSLRQWIEQLPVADMSASTRMLFNAIHEVSRLNISAAARMDLIELLRPAIHFSCKGLKKSYLNQPIIMPEQPRKIANLSQALRQHLINASLRVVIESQKKMGSLLLKPSTLLNKAIYFSLYDMQQMLICNYVLYRPVEENFWLSCHQLFEVAEHYKLSEKLIKLGSSEQADSSKNIYKQLMLWGCIKANQLRQDDIRELKTHLLTWSTLITFEAPTHNLDNRLLIDTSLDTPPIYQHFRSEAISEHCFTINTTALVAALKPLSDPLMQGKSKLSPNLIHHLILAWSIFTDRTFMRLEANMELSVCIGLTASHYFLSNKQSFEHLVYGSDGSPNQMHVKTSGGQKPSAQIGNSNFSNAPDKKLDEWDESLYGSKSSPNSDSTETLDFDVSRPQTSHTTQINSPNEQYQCFDIRVINMSPGGYCLEWHDHPSGSIKAGEIISVRAEHHNTWHIANIRWVKQQDNRVLQLGIELISPSAEPYGAKLVALSGQDKTDYLRVFLLPEIPSAGQQASIITPSLSFKPGQHVHLMLNGKEETILLREQKSATGSFSQFSFERIEALEIDDASAKIDFSGSTEPATSKNRTDSVWELL